MSAAEMDELCRRTQKFDDGRFELFKNTVKDDGKWAGATSLSYRRANAAIKRLS
jgi:hypothetical protein